MIQTRYVINVSLVPESWGELMYEINSVQFHENAYTILALYCSLIFFLYIEYQEYIHICIYS
jgi:hypothetical protein